MLGFVFEIKWTGISGDFPGNKRKSHTNEKGRPSEKWL